MMSESWLTKYFAEFSDDIVKFFLLTTNDQNDHQRQIIAVNDSGEDPGDVEPSGHIICGRK